MPYLIGILLALATTLGARIVGLDRDRAFYAVILAITASYYVLFAAMAGPIGIVTIEAAIGLLFLLMMITGFRANLWWIAAGLLAHAVLDAVHGQVIPNRGVPAWWPAFCAAFDVTAAAVLAMFLSVRGGRVVRIAARVAAAIALIVFAAPAVAAQTDSLPRARNAVSLTIVQTRPVGALGHNIGLGYGVTGSFFVQLDRRGLLSVRADIGAAEYGSEEKRVAFSESVGGRVEVKVRTINAIVPASIGLQLTLPAGPLFTYATAGVGGQAFYTESHVEPISGGNSLVSTINQSDVAPAWTVGGGIYIPVRVGASSVMIDLGAQYIGGGRAQYLAPGSIADLPSGQIAFTPMYTATHLVVVRIGARLGL